MVCFWFYHICTLNVWYLLLIPSRDNGRYSLVLGFNAGKMHRYIKTRRPSNGTVRSGLNKIQNLWKTRRRKKNEGWTGREEERAGNGRTGSTYTHGGASQWIWIKMGWRKGGDTPESERRRKDNWKGKERKSQKERGRKRVRERCSIFSGWSNG